MLNFDKSVLINNLRTILQILRTREPNLRDLCSEKFIRQIKNSSLEIIIKKCVFVLGHCTLRNIALLHRRGIFREKIFLQMIGELLTLRKVNDSRIIQNLMHEFNSFQGLHFST